MKDLHELNKVNIEEPNSNSVRTDTTTHKLVNKEITSGQVNESEAIITLKEQLDNYKDHLTSHSRTAKFWLQYLDYFDIMKMFIRAERVGN